MNTQEVIDELRSLRDEQLEKCAEDMDPIFQKEYTLRAECYQNALRLMGAI